MDDTRPTVEHTGRTTAVTASDRWIRLPRPDDPDLTPPMRLLADQLPPGVLDDPRLDLVLVRAQGTEEWHDTFTTAVEPFGPGVGAQQWQHQVTSLSLRTIPGYQIVDMTPWATDEQAGLVTTGTYILDTISLTLTQWTWVVEDADGGGKGVTVTAICPTHQLADSSAETIPMFESTRVL